MKRRLPEEITGLKHLLKRLSFILVVILFSDFSYSQIPFKGFCKLTAFQIDSGYTKLQSINFDQDEYSDLLCYNPLSKNISLYEGEANLNFKLIQKTSLSVELSKLEPIVGNEKLIESYAFTSRKSRNFGILKFSPQGNPDILNSIKLNSYPENISISDFNSDGRPKFLLSGNSFDGLSIIYYNLDKLEEDKIVKHTAFLNAQFVDLNNDDLKDIAAINSIENTLHFFFNDSRNNFTERRKIKINEDILHFQVFDINYDSYTDIIVSTNSSIKIFFGDATVSYANVISIPVNYPVNDFVIGDFNRDGYFDFNYLSAKEGVISTIFAKDFFTFHNEIIQIKKKGISDLIPYFSKFVYGTAFVDESGKANVLSSTKSISDDHNISIGINPTALSVFDLTDNGINDIVFIDNYDQSLKFILRNAAGVLEKYYSINLFITHNYIIPFNNSKTIKTFFCYSLDKKIIEAIEVDFEKFTYKKEILYASGQIKEIIIDPDENDNPRLYVLYSKQRELNLEIISKTTMRYNHSTYTNITNNWISPAIISLKNLTISYWKNEVDSVKLDFVYIDARVYTVKTKAGLLKNENIIISRSDVINENIKPLLVSFLYRNERNYLVTGDTSITTYYTKQGEKALRITDKKQVFFGKNNSIFVYDHSQKTLNLVVTFKRNNRLAFKEVFNDLNLTDYFITKLDQRNSHLIYTNANKGIIGIKQLPRL